MSFYRLVFPLGLALVAFGLMSWGRYAGTDPGAVTAAVDAVLLEAASISSLAADGPFESAHSFGHDLRQPRKPRLRGERPTKPHLETDSTTESVLAEVDLDRSHRRLLWRALDMAALAGHPSELLRPPSLSA